MLVLFVLALATSIAVPALGPALESVRAEAAARRAASFLDEARRRSVLRRETVTIRCDTEEGVLQVEGEGGPSFRIPDRSVLVSCAPEELRYFPQGYATGATLLVRDPRGRERRVTVGAFTGLARVEPVP